jgi:hypothetical protein
MRRVLVGAAGLLAAFHVWIFGGQVLAGEIANPGRLSRWTVAALLASALWAMRRQGRSLTSGRKAVALWTLAALLHGPVLVERFEGSGETGSPSPMAAFEIVPLLLGVAIAVDSARRSSFARAAAVPRPTILDRVRALDLAFFAPEAPRPPPGNRFLFVS